MLEAEIAAGISEGFRAIARAAISHHPGHSYAQAEIVGDGRLEKGDGARLLLIGQDQREALTDRHREHRAVWLFVAAATMVATLAKAHAEGRLEEKLTQLAKPKLLIIDELGYLPFEPDAAHLFFQLVSHCYERGALVGW